MILVFYIKKKNINVPINVDKFSKTIIIIYYYTRQENTIRCYINHVLKILIDVLRF